ncbi:MAG: hypothetical protein V4844_12070 [Pseudomonadota bacterium]
MASDILKLIGTPPNLWDMAEDLGLRLEHANRILGRMGQFLEQIPDLDAQAEAFTEIESLSLHLEKLGRLEEALRRASSLRE